MEAKRFTRRNELIISTLMEKTTIDSEILRMWLEGGQPVFILDIRPKDQREEWKIPGSNYLDAYQRLNAGDTSVLDEIEIPDNIPVVTVCAAGRTSQLAAKELAKKGIKVYSLEGGMKGWSLSWNTAELRDGDLKIIQVRRTGKGCLSYILGSGKEAIVIDASLDSKIYTKIARENDWTIIYVLDTHIHADHLSRSLDLSQKANAKLYMPDQNKLKFKFNPIKDGDELIFGSSKLKAIHTPGHTLDSTTYFINEKFILTGDTLFTDGVGRPDLKASDEEIKVRASLLYDSLMKLINCDPELIVFPGHISKPVPFDHQIISVSIKDIKEKVSSLSLPREEFINTIISKIPPTPPNYLKVAELNLSGEIKDLDVKEIEAGANRCAIS
jgi:glyoxylase-like metal-dependent hydrolase (beta-lactamase superfamily II)/rhodanese-related sulfurtransferase